jgi:hypothetical protein
MSDAPIDTLLDILELELIGRIERQTGGLTRNSRRRMG